MCLLYAVSLRVGCVGCYTALEGCVCVFCWKTEDLTCLNGLSAALDEWHSEAGFKWRSIGMRRLTEIMTAAVFVFSIPSFAASASFDCAKASTANEIAICSDADLSVLDETLAAVYKEARGNVSDSERLKIEQINWIKSLGTCDGNVDCLINAYKTRMLVLDYSDGQLSLQLDPLQERIAALNEREEILVLRENALTTELRALNSAMERFEEEKLALANANISPLVVEEVSEDTPVFAGCLPSAKKSLSYCSGYLGMMFEFMSTPHDFFDDRYLEVEAIRVDKQCNYYNQTSSLTGLEWAEFMHNAGKMEFSLLMQSQDVPKLTALRDECASIYEAYDSSK